MSSKKLKLLVKFKDLTHNKYDRKILKQAIGTLQILSDRYDNKKLEKACLLALQVYTKTSPSYIIFQKNFFN